MRLSEETALEARIGLRLLQDAQLCLYQTELRERTIAEVRAVSARLMEASETEPGGERRIPEYAQLQLLKYLYRKYPFTEGASVRGLQSHLRHLLQVVPGGPGGDRLEGNEAVSP